MWKNLKLRALNLFRRWKELPVPIRIKLTCKTFLVLFFFSFFFYDSLLAFPFLFPIGLFYFEIQLEENSEHLKQQLRKEFRDAMLSVASNLRAGYAIENAFRESYREMKLLFGKSAEITKWLGKIMNGLDNRRSIESLMEDFGEQTGIEDIQEFASVFNIAKRSGGNLVEILQHTAMTIGEKIEVDREIEVVVAAKRYEQKVMNVIPFGIVFYIKATSPDYFNCLYHQIPGGIIMTVCLAVYLIAYMLGRKITDIRI